MIPIVGQIVDSSISFELKFRIASDLFVSLSSAPQRSIHWTEKCVNMITTIVPSTQTQNLNSSWVFSFAPSFDTLTSFTTRRRLDLYVYFGVNSYINNGINERQWKQNIVFDFIQSWFRAEILRVDFVAVVVAIEQQLICRFDRHCH